VRAPVEVLAGDGREGAAAGAPYDRIVVTASAGTIYPAWWEQLAEGGLVEAPLRLGDGVQPVVTFRRAGARLVSTEVLCGSFMTLRDADGASLTGEEHGMSVAGTGVGLRLSGGSVGALGAEGRRALLRLFLEEPRVRAPVWSVPFWSLGLYLSLTVPASRFLGTWPAGFGVATSDGRGAAVVVACERGVGRPRAHELRAYGDPAAEVDLRRRLAHWEALGGPGEQELALTVDFADGTPKLRRRWRRGRALSAGAPR
jgi:PAS domain-containing protein